MIVALRLRDASGKLISDNTYVQGTDDASYQKLNALGVQKLELKASAVTAGDERIVTVQIENNGKQAALGTKLTLVDSAGARILPALYSDNYLTVLPGEPRVIVIRYPANLGTRATIKVRGWNVQATSARVSAGASEAYLPGPYPQPWQQPVTTPAPAVKSATATLPKK